MLDFIIGVAAGLIVLSVIYFQFFKKKNGKSCCADCSTCSSTCSKDNITNTKEDEK